MKIIKATPLETEDILLLVSDSTDRKFNVAIIPDYVDINKEEEIDWGKAYYFHFERMISNKEKAEKAYNELMRIRS